MANISELQAAQEVLPGVQRAVPRLIRSWRATLWQMMRFGIVGILNTLIDVLALNILLWRFPTRNVDLLLLYNSIAYILGALNSFSLNKYWTFGRRYTMMGGELVRFAIVNVVGILCNDGIIWVVARTLHPLIANSLIWVNVSKLIAIAGTMIISYFGMRLWVFAQVSHERRDRGSTLLSGQRFARFAFDAREQAALHDDTSQTPAEVIEKRVLTSYSLSVILPAYNEETVIGKTVYTVVDVLSAWVQDFEVIVVNDGSKDNTRAIVEDVIAADPRVRLINHPANRGYGAALVSGFEAVSKDLAFFMDSDGQFDIRDLERFFPLIDQYDAVLGYRVNRQDTWMRKLNAWGWKLLVGSVFGLRVRDVDCAFKLYRANFFREHRLETRGAMINTEILYKFTRAGYTYTQLGVRHLPRRGGRATGAKPAVIARAFRELFNYARKWHREEQALTQRKVS